MTDGRNIYLPKLSSCDKNAPIVLLIHEVIKPHLQQEPKRKSGLEFKLRRE